jgi:hypothetical protein
MKVRPRLLMHMALGHVAVTAGALAVLSGPEAAELGGWQAIGGASNAGNTCLHYEGATQTLLVGTVEGFLYYDIPGQAWTAREDTGWIGRTVQSIAAHPGEPGTIVTGRVNAFFKGYLELTEDWGVSSQLVYSSQGGVFKDLQVDPFAPDVFYACGWHDITPGDLVKSTDGGHTWATLPGHLHYTMTEIATDSRTPNTLYVSGDQQVTRSTDAGQTWVRVAEGLPSGLGVYCVAVSPQDSLILVAANDNGVYRTTDGGGQWVLVDSRDCQHFACNPVVPDMMTAVTFSPYKLLLSTDSGATWADRTDGFAGQQMVDVVFSGSGQQLYVSSAQAGVFARPVYWQEFPIVLEVSRIDGGVRLIWSAGYPFPLYNVYRAASVSGPFSKIASTSQTQYEDSPLGASFFYRVTGEE